MHDRVPAVIGMLGASAALWASSAFAGVSGVRTPSHSQRTAILRALVKDGGSTAGVGAVYLADANGRFAAACQRTPDAGNVAFLFRASGRSWRYLLNTRSATASSRAERALERACLP